MKRILMLRPEHCASGDFTKNNIYEVIKDEITAIKPFINDENEKDELDICINYSKVLYEKINNSSEYVNVSRWITVKDNSSKDSFEVHEEDDRIIIFENNRELAHKLIDIIDGLDDTIVNMALLLQNRE